MAGATEHKTSDWWLLFTFLTLDVQVDPLAHSRRHVVAGYAEIGAHVLPPDLGDLQSVASPDLHRPGLVVAAPHSDVAAALPPPHDGGLRHTVRPAVELCGVLVLPGRHVPAGPRHVNVGRDLDTEPGRLGDHGVRVDLTHVTTAVLQLDPSEHDDVTGAPHVVLPHLMCRLNVDTDSPLTETLIFRVIIWFPMARIAFVSPLTQPT